MGKHEGEDVLRSGAPDAFSLKYGFVSPGRPRILQEGTAHRSRPERTGAPHLHATLAPSHTS